MKILIRKANRKLYMNSGDWTKNAGQAHNFKLGRNAIAFALEHDLKKVEVTYAFPNSKYNFSIRIPPAFEVCRAMQQSNNRLRLNCLPPVEQ